MPLHRVLALLLLALTPAALTAADPAIHDLRVKDIDGQDTSLAAYQGRVLLIVNVASQCGLTPQYKALQSVYASRRDAGLVVLGFPCNQFGGQEPGSNAEIKSFCSASFRVTFPLFDKVDVNGDHRHPLYHLLAGPDSPVPGDIPWNFTKFLVGRDGRILARFAPNVSPDAPAVLAAIDEALAAKP